MLSRLIDAGSHAELPDFLRNRVQPTNILTLCLIFFVALPFFVISLFYAPFLAFLPGLGIVTSVGVLVANFYGCIRVSRFFIAALPIWQAITYNAYLTEAGGHPIGNLYLISLSFLIVPFVIIDGREKLFLGATALFCSLAIVLFPTLAELFTLTAEQQAEVQGFVILLRSGWMSTLTGVLAILATFSSMWAIISINRQAEQAILVSRQETEAFNQQLLHEKQDNEQKAQKLKEAQDHERKQQWMNVGVNKIAEVIRLQGNHANDRSHDRGENIFDAILKSMVKYLKATQGGFYVVTTSENKSEGQFGKQAEINLAACYAYERKKYVSQTLSPGEGLLGQAYLEKTPAYFTEIPENYVRITSGLGQARPRCLLIVPMMVNGVVEGLIELASFNPLQEHEQSYVEQAGEVIAAFIQSNRNVRSMEEVLKRTQEQAEQLASQEEEIRQTMEEMQATHEQHERSMEEMKQERDALLTRIAGLERQEA